MIYWEFAMRVESFEFANYLSYFLLDMLVAYEL
jgi:hypothetical protein